MSRAITVRLEEADHVALEQQAGQLQIRPGTLARILVHAGLSAKVAGPSDDRARTALDRLVRQSRTRPSADAVKLVAEARVALHAEP